MVNICNMKTFKLSLILLFSVIISINKTSAQTNKEEAAATYQMAQEEYEKHNYKQAIAYFDRVEELNPNDYKVRTSYLKAKCYEIILTLNKKSVDSIYLNYSKNVEFYLTNGKDVAKKSEMLKMKIVLDNNDDYKIIKEFENYTAKQAIELIKKIQKECPNVSEFTSIDLVDTSKLEFIILTNCPSSNLAKRYLFIVDINLFHSYIKNDDPSTLFVDNENAFSVYCKSYDCDENEDEWKDISKYKSIREAHGIHKGSEYTSNFDIHNKGLNIQLLYDSKSEKAKKENYEMKMMRAFRVLQKENAKKEGVITLPSYRAEQVQVSEPGMSKEGFGLQGGGYLNLADWNKLQNVNSKLGVGLFGVITAGLNFGDIYIGIGPGISVNGLLPNTTPKVSTEDISLCAILGIDDIFCLVGIGSSSVQSYDVESAPFTRFMVGWRNHVSIALSLITYSAEADQLSRFEINFGLPF